MFLKRKEVEEFNLEDTGKNEGQVRSKTKRCRNSREWEERAPEASNGDPGCWKLGNQLMGVEDTAACSGCPGLGWVWWPNSLSVTH